MQAKNKVVAFPRNPLHIKLLADNYPEVDVVLFRERFLERFVDRYFSDKKNYIGRERRATKKYLFLDVINVFFWNRAYYKRVGKLLGEDVGKVIIFLENEPLECYFEAKYKSKIELWEEGVMHYVETFNKTYFYLRKIAQLISGYYPRNIFRLRMDKDKLVVKDRFLRKNLKYKLEAVTSKPVNKIAFIGNALIDDKVVTAKQLASLLIEINNGSGVVVEYLPHPRESDIAISSLSQYCEKCDGVIINTGVENTLQYCTENDFVFYLSPLSSTLLDIQKFNKSAWVPALFGYQELSDGIRKAGVFPVHCCDTLDEVLGEINAVL